MSKNIILFCLVALSFQANGQAPASRPPDNSAQALKEPFRGITRDGKVMPGLFKIQKTGVYTEPVKQAAVDFLAGLTEEQRKKTTFAHDDIEWRTWDNRSFPA